MTTVFFDAVFKPFFKTVHDTGQQLTIDWTNFLMDGFLQIPPKGKNHTLKDRESEGATARLLTNASYTNTQCSTGQVSIATEVANTEEKNADHLVPPPD